MSTSSVTQKGQVTVPSEFRRALGLKTGSRVRFSRHGRRIVIEAVDEAPVESLFGTFRAAKGRGIRDIDAAIEAVRRDRWEHKSRKPARKARS